MDKFDEYLKNKSHKEDKEFILPKSFEDKLEETLGNLDKVNEEKNDNWYKNKKIWATAACFAFVCLAGISMTYGFNSNNSDSMLRNSENQAAKYDAGLPEMASDNSTAKRGVESGYSGEENKIEEFSLQDSLEYSFIDDSNIDKIIIKSLGNDNTYKSVDNKSDITKIIDFINNNIEVEIEKQDINDWDFLLQTSGVDSNHSIIIQDEVMNVDNKWYKIDYQEGERLKEIYNELNYTKVNIPYCNIN